VADFSPDSSQLAFAVRRGTKWQMSNPNKPDNPICDYVSEPVFDPEGRHLAYYSTVGYILTAAWFCPTIEPSACRAIRRGGPQPQPRWEILGVCFNCKETGLPGERQKKEGVYKILGPFQFSPDSQHNRLRCVRSSWLRLGQGVWAGVVDGKESGQ